MNAPIDVAHLPQDDDCAAPAATPTRRREGPAAYAGYLLAGTGLGILFMQAQVLSWFRIQEMFRFESFHMYGVIGTAVAVGLISMQIIKRTKVRTIHGEEIHVPAKEFNKGQIYGGLLFGLGWAITGACPGPLFAQIGAGLTVAAVTFLSAVAGTWVYGLLRERLPH